MTNRIVTLYLVTWNVADKGPPEDSLADLLYQNGDSKPHVLAIGLQEAKKEKDWLEEISSMLLPHDYVLVKQRSLWAIHLFVFVQRRHLLAVHNIESEATRSGIAGVMGNKGGVSVRMDLYGVNFIIVNAHFTAHITENHERIEDFMDIIDNQRFKDSDVEKLLDHDFVFWMGDLNFRLSDVDHHLVLRKIEQGNLSELWKFDQLHTSKDAGMIFDQFKEGQLSFNPTYKFDKGTDRYDTSSKKRKPAWTDRVLHLINEDNFENLKLSIDQVKYDSLTQYKSSDHKPVYALYNLRVFDTPPRMPVVMETPDDPRCGRTGKLRFSYRVNHKCKQRFTPTSWDWIGLYPSNFSDFQSYVTHAYVPSADGEETDFGVYGIMQLPTSLTAGSYQLVYFSNKKNCPVGYSGIFQLHSQSQARAPVTMVTEAEYKKGEPISFTYTVHHACKLSFPISPEDELQLVLDGADDKQQQTLTSQPVPSSDADFVGFEAEAQLPPPDGIGVYRILYFSKERGCVVGRSHRFYVRDSCGNESHQL